MNKKENISLIGMAGVGKTALGKKLASYYRKKFIDIDDEIENSEKRSINEIIQEDGDNYFINIEEKITLKLDLSKPSIIATGGSIVYSKKAMNFLKKQSIIIFLNTSPIQIKNRLHNLEERGVIGIKNKPFEEIYKERLPLYQKYTDMVFTSTHHPQSDDCLEKLISAIKLFTK